MRNQVLIMLAMIVSLACKAGERHQQQVPADTGTADHIRQLQHDYKIRKELQRQWFAAARFVATKTGNSQAAAILAFLSANVYLVAPAGKNQATLLEYPKHKEYPVALLIVLESDFATNPDLRDFAKTRGTVAEYSSEPPLIILRPEKFSRIWQGLLLLHEGGHAQAFAQRHYVINNPLVNAREEVKIHEFQNQLMASLGGDPYQALLKTEVDRIKNIEAQTTVAPGQRLSVGPDSYNLAFDAIFAPARSNLEQTVRQGNFNLHAQFLLIEQEYASEGVEAVAERKTQLYLAVRKARQSR